MASPPLSPPPKTLFDAFISAGQNEIAARILEAAMHLFSEKGYAATSVREIVQAASVTNPMLYYYFDSKKGVFSELISFLFGMMNAHIEEVLRTEHDLEGRLRTIARAHFDACRESPEVLRFIYSVLFGPTQSSPVLDIDCIMDNHRAHVTRAFQVAIDRGEFVPRPGFEPHFAAELFMGLINNHLMGVLTTYERFADHPDLDTMLDEYLSDSALERMFDYFFHGVGRLAR